MSSLEDIEKALRVQLQKAVDSCANLRRIAHEATALSNDINELTTPCIRMRARYLELATQLSEALLSDQFQSYIPYYNGIRNTYENVERRADNFDYRFEQANQVKQEVWIEIDAVMTVKDVDEFGELLINDTDGVMKRYEESIKKALEVKTCFEELKIEWNRMKHRFVADIEDCMQRAHGLLFVIRQGQGQVVSEE